MGRSSLLTQGSLNKAMLCSKPLHFCAGGFQEAESFLAAPSEPSSGPARAALPLLCWGGTR